MKKFAYMFHLDFTTQSFGPIVDAVRPPSFQRNFCEGDFALKKLNRQSVKTVCILGNPNPVLEAEAGSSDGAVATDEIQGLESSGRP